MQEKIERVEAGFYERCYSYLKGSYTKPVYDVDTWSTNKIRMPEALTADPGKWKSIKYQEAVHNAILEPKKRIVFAKSARTGGTRSLVNILLYHIDQDPCSQLILFPTDEDANGFSKDDFDKTLFNNPSIARHIDEAPVKGHKAKSADTISQKQYPGGTLYLSGASSAKSLRRLTVRIVYFDECSSFLESSEAKGDPFSLGETRAKTYRDDARFFYVSTPGNENKCKVTELYELSDKRKFFVPCPFCNFYQVLYWENFYFTGENASPQNPKFKCQNEKCEKLIEEKHKIKMVESGRWEATENIPKNKETIGFWIWEAYSPYSTWQFIATEFLESKDHYERARAFTNNVLAKVWTDYGETLAWRKIYKRRKGDANILPEEKFVLVAGADVQNDRIEVTVCAFKKNKRVKIINHKVFQGSPYEDEVWMTFQEFITKKINGYAISVLAVDSGNLTQNVYRFCSYFTPKNVIPVKGASTTPHPAIMASKFIDVKFGAKVKFNATRLFMVGTDTIKDEIFYFLKKDAIEDKKEEKEREYHFEFASFTQEYFEQICSEGLVKKKDALGKTSYRYKQNRSRNEALDCLVYAHAAYYHRHDEFESYLLS